MADTRPKQSHGRGVAMIRFLLGIAQMVGAAVSFGYLVREGFTVRTSLLIYVTLTLTAVSVLWSGFRGTWGR